MAACNREFLIKHEELKALHEHFVITLVDKAANYFALVCKKFYVQTLMQELGVTKDSDNWRIEGNGTYVKKDGVEIKTDNEIIKGFTVGLKGQDVYIDFTSEAIAEALMKFLRPQLADIVNEAANQK